MAKPAGKSKTVNFGEILFRYRDYTPIPLLVLLLLSAEPGVFSATLGTILVAIGEFLRLYSVAFIGKISRTRKNHLGKSLITAGPFAYSRNPLYIGNFIICLGFIVYANIFWLLAVYVLLFIAQYHFIIRFEEKILLESFADEYKNYMKKVPRWFPKRWPVLSDLDWPDSFSEALASEKRTLTAIVVLLIVLALFY